jgi:hypothetical protein
MARSHVKAVHLECSIEVIIPTPKYFCSLLSAVSNGSFYTYRIVVSIFITNVIAPGFCQCAGIMFHTRMYNCQSGELRFL